MKWNGARVLPSRSSRYFRLKAEVKVWLFFARIEEGVSTKEETAIKKAENKRTAFIKQRTAVPRNSVSGRRNIWHNIPNVICIKGSESIYSILHGITLKNHKHFHVHFR
jgi:hypothetical protein